MIVSEQEKSKQLSAGNEWVKKKKQSTVEKKQEEKCSIEQSVEHLKNALMLVHFILFKIHNTFICRSTHLNLPVPHVKERRRTATTGEREKKDKENKEKKVEKSYFFWFTTFFFSCFKRKIYNFSSSTVVQPISWKSSFALFLASYSIYCVDYIEWIKKFISSENLQKKKLIFCVWKFFWWPKKIIQKKQQNPSKLC